MIDYRLFFICDAHVFGAFAFEAESDLAAVDCAEALRAGGGAELWNRARRVEVFPAAAALPEGAPEIAKPTLSALRRMQAAAQRGLTHLANQSGSSAFAQHGDTLA